MVGGRVAVGNLLIAANCLCYSVYLVALKPLRGRYPTVVMMAWVYLLSLPAVPWLAGASRAKQLDALILPIKALAFGNLLPKYHELALAPARRVPGVRRRLRVRVAGPVDTGRDMAFGGLSNPARNQTWIMPSSEPATTWKWELTAKPKIRPE